MPIARRLLSRLFLVSQLLPGLFLLGLSGPVAAQKKLKVHISADMEGITGVVTDSQLGPTGFEYQRFRELMTAEVVAAIDGARAAGATDFLVADSHGNGENLIIERLPKDAQVVRAWPRPQGMMQGIDSSFAAALLIGYHTGAANPEGIRAHTFSSANLADVRMGGKSVPESVVSAAIAGHFGVPVVLISGDEAAVKEARKTIGDVEGAVVKWPYGFHSARTLTPQAGADLIREKAREALGRLRSFKPYRIATPVEVEIQFKHYRPAEVLAFLSIVERTGARTIRFRAKDVLEASRFLQFVGRYQPDLSP